MSFLVDGHLDLAFNAVGVGRDLTRPVMALRRAEKRKRQEVLVTLPELQRAGIAVVFATLFTIPRDFLRPEGAPALTVRQQSLTYETPEEAERLALDQLAAYERWESEGWIRLIRSRADLEAHLAAFAAGDPTVGAVLLMEGADPIKEPAELAVWHGRGLRVLGPAWQKTRYCGGTFCPGPLTAEGRELIAAMNALGLPLDVSHLAEESFWDAMALDPVHVLASHSNARALTPTDRHLTDEMIGEIGRRDGIVGLVLGNEFIKAGVTKDSPKTSVTLDDVRRQAEHVAALIGWERVAIGSDWDGGFGLQETPVGITRGADFRRLGEVAPPEARAGFLGENWLRFLRRVLPD